MEDRSRPWKDETGFRALVQNVPGAVYRCEVRAPWRVSQISDGVRALTGRPAADFMDGRLAYADMVFPEDLPALHQAVEAGVAARQPFVAEYRIVHADGSIRWVHETGQAAYNGDGPVYLEGVILDVTARHRAEDALRESENRYRTAFLTSPDAVNINRLSDGMYLDVNEGFTRLTGWTRDEVMGRTSAEIGIWENPADRQRMVDDLAREGVCNNLEAVFRSKDGTTRTGLISARVIQQGGVPCILSVTRDISARTEAEAERRRFERQLLQTQKLESLGVLAGGIAHDFNNILMAVLGHAELALDDLPPSSSARVSVQEIATAARRAADLCRQMLAYSGRASFAAERVDLGALIAEMAHLLKTTISKKAALNVRVEPNLPAIKADPSQIRQVVMNLIINASEALEDRSGVITLAAAATRREADFLRTTELARDLRPGTYVHVEVSDTGCGMSPETRARIFEPFFTTKFSGRGLGLAAVLGIVRGHRGALTVESEPGAGTTFTVLFPAAEEVAVRDDPHTLAAAAWKGSGTVLLADDEESVRRVATRMLERLGLTVIAAADGREAVDLYRLHRDKVALVMLDLTMPHLDGAEAFGELCRINPGVRVVLASGYGQEDLTSRFAGSSLAGVLQKPYTFSQVRELLRGLLPPARETGTK